MSVRASEVKRVEFHHKRLKDIGYRSNRFRSAVGKKGNETGSGMKGKKIDFPVTCDLPVFETGENRPLEFYIQKQGVVGNAQG